MGSGPSTGLLGKVCWFVSTRTPKFENISEVLLRLKMLAAPLALLAFAASAFAATPTPPPLTYLYSVNLTFGDPILIGQVPYGKRDLLTISGGTFSGPKLTGKYP